MSLSFIRIKNIKKKNYKNYKNFKFNLIAI